MAEIVDLPMKMVNGDFPGRYVTVYQRVWVAWMEKWSNSTVDVPALFDYWRVHMIQDLPIQCHVTLLHDQLVIHFVWSGPLVLARSFWHAYTPPFLPWLIRSSSRECVHIVIYLFIMHIYRCLINDILYTTYPWFIISLYYMYIYIYAFTMIYINDLNAVPPGYPPLSHSRGDRFWFLLCHRQKGSRLKGVCRTPQKL